MRRDIVTDCTFLAYEGKRLQTVVYTGIASVTRENQGVVWPRSGH